MTDKRRTAVLDVLSDILRRMEHHWQRTSECDHSGGEADCWSVEIKYLKNKIEALKHGGGWEMSEEQAQCDPTEKTLYREPHSDHYGTWQDRLYVCGPLPRQGIGIDVGGTVYVRPLKQWHGIESELIRLRDENKKYKNMISDIRQVAFAYENGNQAYGIRVCLRMAEEALSGSEGEKK